MRKYTNNILLCLLLILDFIAEVKLDTTEAMVEFWTIPAQIESFPIEHSVSKCATDLIQCYSMTIFKIAICAVREDEPMNSANAKRSFATFCDMHYHNCKNKATIWHYVRDDDGSGKC